ncbi:MAG TPA: 2-succinyl-5-enolpyruvyl-6-hydroxy-3-cyclohexene-1-carboxylic-acid synthase [Acidimicrobiales bacterium]|nr:2-succinyl-5-enolpyruvyl-6-hydroxy-3-cyclohexene-1-carboxylic-acid synthase [Acidimicrobiales bacterium]
MTLQDAFAATLVDEWARNGVTEAVVAPGSRSTPLAVALAADGRLRLHVVLDERSAAFFALGLGLASGRPALVLTTSGTAAAELHPAVVEAHQARVPLIACTADRPPDLHHVGAPQTVEQDHLFAGAVRWAHAPGVADDAGAGSWRSLAARAVAEATANPAGPGPVHLNLAFREPLTGEPDRTVAGRRGGAAWHVRTAGSVPAPAEVTAALAGAGARGLIVAGAGAGDPDAVHRLAEAVGWPVLADPRSGCRLGRPTTVAAADALLRVPTFADGHRPDLVLRLGAPWASRVVGEWLAGLDVPQYLVDPNNAWLDPGRSATTVVAADPTAVVEAVAGAGPAPGPEDWTREWMAAEAAAQGALDATLAGSGLTEPGIARSVVDALPAGATLFVSSSMPIRDVEWYGRPRSALRVLANRGANGIDGVVSTALGTAVAGGGHTVAVVGDLAFLHDSNGLLIPPGTGTGVDATIVVVDNDGGGIFSFLPQATSLSEARFERLLGTPHGLDLAAVARAHGVEAGAVSTVDEVAAAAARRPQGVRVFVARTPGRAANAALHAQLNRAVGDALGA